MSVRRIHKKKDGYLLIEEDGTARFLTRFESIRYRLFGTFPVPAMIDPPNGVSVLPKNPGVQIYDDFDVVQIGPDEWKKFPRVNWGNFRPQNMCCIERLYEE